jgi:hypothetical protein
LQILQPQGDHRFDGTLMMLLAAVPGMDGSMAGMLDPALS